jgi:hypothetical protein
LVLRSQLPGAMNQYFKKMGIRINTLDAGHPLKNGGAYIALSDYSQMSLPAQSRLEVTLKVYRRVTRHLASSESSALSEVSAQSISVPRKNLQHAEGTGP